MITLAKDFDFHINKEVDTYYFKKDKYKKLPQPQHKITPTNNVVEYFKNRCISEETLKKYQVTQRNDSNAIVFPFFDENDVLQFVKYRNIDTNNSCKEYCEAKCKPILFGMNVCTDDREQLIITEGQIDCLSVAEAGFNNVVSVPTGKNGFTWIPYCWDWVQSFKSIVVFGDLENGKITLLEELSTRFPNKVKHVKIKDYLGHKDANEILCDKGKQAIENCIKNAEFAPISKVVRLSDVESLNIDDLEKMRTGITRLDTILKGGLIFGQVTIVAGKRGDGKSTLIGQITKSALQQNIKTFIYSGELPVTIFKSQLDMQIAGDKYIVERENGMYTSYFLPNTVKEKINKWYSDNIFIYDIMQNMGSERISLIKMIEEVILKYGCRFIVVDNLMTALMLDADPKQEELQNQTNFVGKLVETALKYNVIIVLVAHKRKTSFVGDHNDEISGSANVTNLAGVVLHYDRDKDIPADQRKLRITKSRIAGTLDFDGIDVKYSKKSKRIYCTEEELNEDSGFDDDNDGFIPIPEQVRLLFDD